MFASRRLAVAAFLVCGGFKSAHASFDLMYIPTASQDQITRYDPVNRVFLGGINAPNVTQVVYGGGQYGQALINAGNNFRFDFHSGSGAGFAPFTADSYDYLNNRGIRATGSTISTIDIVNRTQTTVNLSGASAVLRANYLPNGNILALSTLGGSLTGRIHTASGALVSTFSVLSGVTINRASNALVTVNRAGNGLFSVALLDSTNVLRYVRVQVNAGNVWSFSTNTVTSFAATTSVALAPAHDGFYAVGGDATTPATLTRFLQYDDEGYGNQWNSWSENLVPTGAQSVYSIGMVLAPEPQAFLPLGLGLGALVLRRRKRLL